ncbi:MAG: hypothetical protein H6727_13175, partial [Myxococcales bacterium]|nr:hypothetical protein [Myxococcales bacterium]
MSSRKLAKLLTEAGLLPEDAANELLQKEKDSAELTIDSLICQAGHAEPAQIDHFLSEAFRLTKVDLPEVLSPQQAALDLVDAENVLKYQAIPYAVDEENLWLVACLPLRMSRLQALGESTERTLKISALNQIYFALLLEQFYEIAPPEALLPLIDEWPLPTPEEAADMVYTPPPKEVKKKTKPAEKADETSENTDEAAEETETSEETESPVTESAAAAETEASPVAETPVAAEETAPVAEETAPVAEEAPQAATPVADASAGLSLADMTSSAGFEMTEDLAGSAQAAVQLNETSSPAQPTEEAATEAPAAEEAPAAVEAATEAATEEAAPVVEAAESPQESAEPVAVLPLGVYEAEYLLRNAQTRDGVLELGLHFFSTKLQNAGLFLVRKQAVKGLRMIGTPDQDKSFQSLEISLDTSAFFSAMLDALVPYNGAPSEEPVDRPLFSLFKPPPKHVYLLPIRVRGRTVALLYGHLFEGILSNEDFEQLVRCTYQMAQSLEQVILAVKKGVTEESSAVSSALRAMRKGDASLLQEVLDGGQESIQSIAAEATAAIERVQEEERRIAQERADKLARAADLARTAREQAARQAAQAPVSQTTDFLDATADAPVPSVTQTGDFAAVETSSVAAPVTQTGDFADATAPVTQTGDFVETPKPIKETAAYLDAFQVDPETFKRLSSRENLQSVPASEFNEEEPAAEESVTSEPAAETAVEEPVATEATDAPAEAVEA